MFLHKKELVIDFMNQWPTHAVKNIKKLALRVITNV